MRVLLLSLGTHQVSQAEALEAVSSKFLQINWKQYPDPLLRQSYIGPRIREFQPELTFMQLHGMVFSHRFIHMIPGKKVNWTGDVRDPIPDCYRLQHHLFDLTLFSNETDVRIMQSEGYTKTRFLDIGFEETIYDPMGPKTLCNHPVVFMGNNYHDRFPLSKYRREMVLRFSDRISVFGKRWGLLAEDDLNNNPLLEAETYRAADIGINLSHFQYERYSSDRIYRIMACGCFCLSHYYDGIEKDFTIGEHLDVFHNLDELEQKINYYFDHPGDRARIAKAGMNHVWANHTWSKRIEQLLRYLNNG